MIEKNSETEIGVRGIGVLLLAFILVYTLFFGMQKKRTVTVTDQPTFAEQYAAPIEGPAGGEEENIKPTTVFQVQEAERQELPQETISPTPHVADELEKKGIFSVQSLFEDKPQEEDEGIMMLAGTHHRKGIMKSAELLGLTPSINYILKNNDNTHFVFLGDTPPDIGDVVESQGGNLVALSSKNAIFDHGLFGDSVIIITLPDYQNVKHKQLLLVQFKQTADRWFLQVDDDAYERSKPLFRELFGKRYTW